MRPRLPAGARWRSRTPRSGYSTTGCRTTFHHCYHLVWIPKNRYKALQSVVTHEALEIQLDHRVAIETRALIDEGDDGPTGVAASIHRRESARSTASLEYLLVDPTGRRVAGSLNATAPTVPGYLEFLHYRRGGEHRIAQAITTRLPDSSRLVVAADREVIDEMNATLLKLFAGAFGVMLLLGSRAADCAACPLKPQCTTARQRAVTRLIDEDARDQVRALAGTEGYTRARRRRKRIERVFGHLKRNLKLRTLKLRGLAGAAEEFTMAAAAYNLQLLAKRAAPA